MNQVEKIKEICKERGVPVSKLEKDLGFANGYISQLKKGTVPADRLEKISSYFRVDYHYFLGYVDAEPVFIPASGPSVNGLSADEEELLRLFQLFNSSGRARALDALRELSEIPRYTDKSKESSISETG